MKLLFVTNLYPPRVIGGYEMLCEEVAVQLAARGHETQVPTSDYGGREHDVQEAGIERALRLASDICSEPQEDTIGEVMCSSSRFRGGV